MNEGFHRLQNLRMENDAARFAMDEMRPRFETMKNRKENGTAPQAVSAYQLFQTPPEIARRLVDLLELTPGKRLLEPSAGLGRLLDCIAPLEPVETVAVEISADLTRALYYQRRERVQLLCRDFLTQEPGDLGTFDAIAMNPPFHMRADVRHIIHALQFLKPGGKLAALCMDTPQREAILRPMAATWESIPAGAFKAEGTGVPTILLTINA